jgi:hypothetical protein
MFVWPTVSNHSYRIRFVVFRYLNHAMTLAATARRTPATPNIVNHYLINERNQLFRTSVISVLSIIKK